MQNLDQFSISGFDDAENENGIENDRNPEDKIARRFISAAEDGQLDILTSLLKVNPDLVNVSDKEGYTPLHRACYGNHTEVVKFLLQNGANIAAKTELQWEPLHSCCRWNHIKCATILIKEGANVNASSEGGQTPLHIAASFGTCYDMVQMLLIHPYIDTTLKNNRDEMAIDIAKRSSKFYNVFDMADPLLDVSNFD